MKKVCVIGHFGDNKKLANGQTIKTKIVYDELEKKYLSENVGHIDTYGGIKFLLKLPMEIYKSLKNYKNIVILPAHNGLRFIPLFLVLENIFFKRKLHYVVIGGWLPNFIEKKYILKKLLQKLNAVYVETNSMKSMLEKQGFNNVKVMNNCKNLRIISEEEISFTKEGKYRLCTFSRVMKEKGIEDIVDAVLEINRECDSVLFELDIYGEVDKNQGDWFEKLTQKFDSNIHYKGVIEYDKTTDILKKYYALVFPTYYKGEGFAGTIIDAMAAALPIVASDWKYNSELVCDWQNGLIFRTNDIHDLKNKLLKLIENEEQYLIMKKNCINRAFDYLPCNVLKVLFNNIE